MGSTPAAGRRPRAVVRVLLCALVAAVVGVGGRLVYERQAASVRAEKLEDLASLVRLKVDAIRAWRSERVEDANILSRSPLFGPAVLGLLHAPGDPQLLAAVNDRLELGRDGDYSAILVISAEGDVLTVVPAAAAPPDPEERAAISRALATGTPLFCDLHRAPGGGEPRMDVVGALSGPGGGPKLALLLRIDPRTALDPMIQSWPVYRRTAESLLVRREGDSVAFLSGLRFRPGAALALRLPVSWAQLPAARAALGQTGPFEGRDYRGVEVLAQLEPVPDSPWSLVAKVDTEEILAGVTALAYRVAAFTLLVLLVLGLTAGFLYKHRGKRAFEGLHNAERERREALEAFRTTLYSIGDAVITTDTSGRVNLLNPVAAALTGWGEADAVGRPLPEVFRIVNELTRATVENPVERVLRDGLVVGLANHTLLIARDGTERPIADSGAPIRGEDGSISGVVLVFRDQSRERAAERARALLSDTIDASLDEIYVFDAATLRFRYVNQGALRNLGYALEQIRAMTPLDIKPDLTPESFEKLSGPLVRHELPLQVFETVHRRADGTRYPVEVHLQLFGDSSDRVFLAVTQDITERKAAQEAMREREFWLSESQRVARIGSYVLDFGTGVWTSSPMLDEIFGIDARYARTIDGWGAVIRPEDRSEMLEYLAHLMATRGRFDKEYRIARISDGAVRWVAGFGELTFDPCGRPVRMIGTIQDITERKAAEQRLDASERRYRELFLAHPLPMWVYDLETMRFLAVNDAAVEKYGWSREEFLALSLRDIRPPEDVARLEASVAGSRGLAGLEASKGWRHRTRAGRVFEVEISSHDLAFEGRPGRVVVAHDVTQRKLLEEQLRHAQKMEAVGTLAGGVAHDFNNLLQAMLSVAQGARLRSREPEVSQALAELESHVRSAATLTRQLLLFSRQETPRREVVDLAAVVADGTAMLRRLLPETITLVVESAADRFLVEADSGQVGQVLTNLVVNARDAMPEGGRLSVRAGRAGADMFLEVEDTGTGIPPEVRERIFDPFFTTKGHSHGTGLGLAVVHGIVESHHGRVEVESEPGLGSRFRVLLPAVEAAAGTGPTASAAADALPTGGGERVLLVEDEEGTRAGLAELLGLLRYSVTAVGSGEEAAALPAAPAFDLLLTDFMLPGASGLDVARALAARWPGLKVVLMSGYAADAVSRGQLASDRVRFLEKPFDMTTLARELRAALTEPPVPPPAG